MPDHMLRRALRLCAVVLGTLLPMQAGATSFYSVGVNGQVWPIGGYAGFQNMVQDGPRVMCLPTGGTVCSALSSTGASGTHGTVDTRGT